MRATLLVQLLVAGAVAALLVHWIKRAAYRHDWLDRPNDRSSHQRPTPRGGGLAIVIVTIACSLMLLGTANQLRRDWIIVIAGSAVIALVSWIDDLYSLHTTIRLTVHIAAAVVALAAIGPIERIELPGIFTIGTAWLGVPLTILWIAGLTNIYNFMDGIDGIAAIQGVAASTSWILIASTVNDRPVFVTAVFLAASSGGFLVHNWSPASIFMGDVGSAFTGYLLAVFAVHASGNPRVAFAAALTVWPFLFDGIFTIMRRLIHRENITKAHNSHLYQRLVRCGWSHGVVAAIYGVLAALGGLYALAVVRLVPGWKTVYGAVPLAAVGLWLLVLHAERLRRQTTMPSAAHTASE